VATTFDCHWKIKESFVWTKNLVLCTCSCLFFKICKRSL